MYKSTYDATMHPRPASASAHPPASNRPPHPGPAAATHGPAAGSLARLRQAQIQAPDHGSEVPTTVTARSLELADLRRSWGEAYRITWDDGRFRATHITSGEALDAQSATGLRKLLRDHRSHRATTSPGWPGAGDSRRA